MCLLKQGNIQMEQENIIRKQADRACGTGISQQSFVIFFVLLVLIPYAGYRVISYGVMLLVTPPQAATKIMAGMVERQKEWQNWRNGKVGYIRTIYSTRRHQHRHRHQHQHQHRRHFNLLYIWNGGYIINQTRMAVQWMAVQSEQIFWLCQVRETNQGGNYIFRNVKGGGGWKECHFPLNLEQIKLI
jgi:hypothetical protein